MTIKSVAINVLVIAVLSCAVLLAPFTIDAIKGLGETRPVQSLSHDAHAQHFYYEQMIVEELRREPLSWDCHEGSIDRVRYYLDSCFSEHLAEFTLAEPPSQASVQLIARGAALFTDSNGASLRGIHELTGSQANALRSLVPSRLSTLPPYVDNSQMPGYTSAIEACIDGRSFFAIRRIGTDAAYERIASEIASRSGLTISRTSPGRCM